MAINVSTQDLENYPGNLKTVTVDQTYTRFRKLSW